MNEPDRREPGMDGRAATANGADEWNHCARHRPPGIVPSAHLPRTGRWVRRCVTYCHSGLIPGTHLGMPSPDLTLVIGLDGPTRLIKQPDPSRQGGDFAALVGGLHTRPAVIGYGSHLCGLQLDLRLDAAPRLLRVRPAELADGVVELGDLIGTAAGELLDRVHTATSWGERVAAVDAVLGGLCDETRAPTRAEAAWEIVVRGSGSLPVHRVAEAVGWSRRRLHQAFVAELGVTPKVAGRLARFARSQRLLHVRPERSLADVAAQCGYCDQAHMAREWRTLAGVSASVWMTHELFPLIQDDEAEEPASLPA